MIVTAVLMAGSTGASSIVGALGISIVEAVTATRFLAKALAIDEEGRLVIQRENGRQEALRCGEVTTRPARTE